MEVLKNVLILKNIENFLLTLMFIYLVWEFCFLVSCLVRKFRDSLVDLYLQRKFYEQKIKDLEEHVEELKEEQEELKVKGKFNFDELKEMIVYLSEKFEIVQDELQCMRNKIFGDEEYVNEEEEDDREEEEEDDREEEEEDDREEDVMEKKRKLKRKSKDKCLENELFGKANLFETLLPNLSSDEEQESNKGLKITNMNEISRSSNVEYSNYFDFSEIDSEDDFSELY